MAGNALNTTKQTSGLAEVAKRGHVSARRRSRLGELPEFRYHYPGIKCARDFTLKPSPARKYL